jgi:hypothetical protein
MPAVAALRMYKDQAKSLYVSMFFQKDASVDERVYRLWRSKVSIGYIKMTWVIFSRRKSQNFLRIFSLHIGILLAYLTMSDSCGRGRYDENSMGENGYHDMCDFWESHFILGG